MALSYNLCLTFHIHFINYRKTFTIRCLSYYTKCDIRGSNAIFKNYFHCHEKKNPQSATICHLEKCFFPHILTNARAEFVKMFINALYFIFFFYFRSKIEHNSFYYRTAKRVLFIDSM